MKYGFIGAGNMGSAIMSGIVKHNPKQLIYAYDVDAKKVKALSKVKYLSLDELVEKCDVIVLAVKPQMMNDVLDKIKNKSLSKKLFISIAAGLDLEYFESKLNKSRVIRVMPNINAIYGEAISAICKGRYASKKDLDTATKIFNCVGETIELKENQLATFSAIAGASPAYVFMFADALALAGVNAGLPRNIAIKAASQAIKGSGVTLLESGNHPDELRDKVCSPGGTTIEGVKVLEENSFKGIIMEAIDEVIEKDQKLSKKSKD